MTQVFYTTQDLFDYTCMFPVASYTVGAHQDPDTLQEFWVVSFA